MQLRQSVQDELSLLCPRYWDNGPINVVRIAEEQYQAQVEKGLLKLTPYP